MADYVIIYTGVITKAGRESGLPAFVTAHAFVKADSRLALAMAITQEMQPFISMQGMAVSRDPSKMVDTSQIDLENRMFVPMPQIMYIKAAFKPITGGLAQANDEGAPVQ